MDFENKIFKHNIIFETYESQFCEPCYLDLPKS